MCTEVDILIGPYLDLTYEKNDYTKNKCIRIRRNKNSFKTCKLVSNIIKECRVWPFLYISS